MNDKTVDQKLNEALDAVRKLTNELTMVKDKIKKMEDRIADSNNKIATINTNVRKVKSMSISTKDRLGSLEYAISRIK